MMHVIPSASARSVAASTCWSSSSRRGTRGYCAATCERIAKRRQDRALLRYLDLGRVRSHRGTEIEAPAPVCGR